MNSESQNQTPSRLQILFLVGKTANLVKFTVGFLKVGRTDKKDPRGKRKLIDWTGNEKKTVFGYWVAVKMTYWENNRKIELGQSTQDSEMLSKNWKVVAFETFGHD